MTPLNQLIGQDQLVFGALKRPVNRLLLNSRPTGSAFVPLPSISLLSHSVLLSLLLLTASPLLPVSRNSTLLSPPSSPFFSSAHYLTPLFRSTAPETRFPFQRAGSSPCSSRSALPLFLFINLLATSAPPPSYPLFSLTSPSPSSKFQTPPLDSPPLPSTRDYAPPPPSFTNLEHLTHPLSHPPRSLPFLLLSTSPIHQHLPRPSLPRPYHLPRLSHLASLLSPSPFLPNSYATPPLPLLTSPFPLTPSRLSISPKSPLSPLCLLPNIPFPPPPNFSITPSRPAKENHKHRAVSRASSLPNPKSPPPSPSFSFPPSHPTYISPSPTQRPLPPFLTFHSLPPYRYNRLSPIPFPIPPPTLAPLSPPLTPSSISFPPSRPSSLTLLLPTLCFLPLPTVTILSLLLSDPIPLVFFSPFPSTPPPSPYHTSPSPSLPPYGSPRSLPTPPLFPLPSHSLSFPSSLSSSSPLFSLIDLSLLILPTPSLLLIHMKPPIPTVTSPLSLPPPPPNPYSPLSALHYDPNERTPTRNSNSDGIVRAEGGLWCPSV
ncbi:hypothetical protein C7M84_008315 [Penaeus vannamei]|uniref:Uncharacterized protein n=1 Tax=Penaeus vannamei TaxID=6689 RepID=A0A423TA57_PENVA|nr:hypothetical protein C7M84_008315 [Penaeus vannamei]